MLSKALQAAAGNAAEPIFIEDTFSSYLYTGNGSTQTITNGIDLAGEGGLVWIKQRTTTYEHQLFDTVRGGSNYLISNTTGAQNQYSYGNSVSFLSSGFSTTGSPSNQSTASLASWTFRKAPKFFDVVTWTGDNSSTRQISHSLGSVPGCIIVKITSGASDNWIVYHRSLGNTQVLRLNLTNAAVTQDRWANTNPTSTYFTVALNQETNQTGCTYVAYLFAHDAGGFGADGSENVISCGSFTTDGNGRTTVTLNYEPQWLLVKRATGSPGTGNWEIADNMRGWTASGNAALYPNLTNAENNPQNYKLNATGFSVDNGVSSSDFIYIAIRRPMKPPTVGTEVFSPNLSVGTTGQQITTDFPVDSQWFKYRASAGVSTYVFDRLRGVSTTTTESGKILYANKTDAETNDASTRYFNNTGYQQNSGLTDPDNYIMWNFKRASGFFDVVCYTGTGVARTVAHNLTVAPELMIVKRRSAADAWAVYFGDPTDYLRLNDPQAAVDDIGRWNDTAPTSTVFTVGTDTEVNTSAITYVAYLFATYPGVSKVFSYTGNGSSQTINCGFTGGARFVLIKRTDSTGDWYVWDTARGMVAGNDPHLSLNTTAAEVTTDDSVDTAASGFIVNQDAATNVNVTSATYIGLAIA